MREFTLLQQRKGLSISMGISCLIIYCFSVSRFPGLNLFALQCNGSHLPSDVRSVQYISLERYSPQPEVPPHIIASLSSVDGVRLENSYGNTNVYVSGRFDGDNIHSTSLTVLLADVILDLKVTYGCKISYIKRGGGLGVTERLLNVSFADLQTLYLLQSDDLEKNHHQQRLAQTPYSETKPASMIWTTPMILLMTMAILLFALFVVCVLLIVDRYRDHCRNRRRMNRMKRNKCDSKEQEGEAEPRPLPSPPSWTYPQVIGEPPPRSPYNRLRFGGVSRNLRDDTGYDSEASMHYCKPFDDVAETSAEKPVLQTFGKQLSPLYATPPNIINS